VIQWTLPITLKSGYPSTVRTPEGVELLAIHYTPQELRGRQVYIREGCWYCHSQFVRPVTGEDARWGPVSQAGEYAFDLPHLFGTRRIGPDLTRVGRKYADSWHIAHHWDPRAVVPDSVMPRFPWLFNGHDAQGVPQMTQEGRDLVAYIQKLGTQIGDWRATFVSTNLTSGSSAQPSAELLRLGRDAYARRCVGCHGEKGDGHGPVAMFLTPQPRDFTRGIFKFRSTPGKDSLPQDSDLYKTISHGLWGTPMPPWYELSERERWGLLQYIKTFSPRWTNETVAAPVAVPLEPSVDDAGIARGQKIFSNAGCLACHGPSGKGDGPLAPILRDVWGHPSPPANFTLPAGSYRGVKLGFDTPHMFTTVMTGVGGTLMEAFAARLKPEEVWDVVHYVQSLRKAAEAQELQSRSVHHAAAEPNSFGSAQALR
jgi:cytochrome c oxidase cbb3-type subunit I/II